jgi:serine/threonine-protein kinase
MTAMPASIGRYAIEAEVGRGTMGVVYRARDTVLQRTVALKTIGGLALAADDLAAFEKRFLNEARVAAALSHPNIVAVHDFGRDDATGTLFIALEFLDGETLDQRVRRGPVEWSSACRVVAAVARALHAAHARRIVHRDVKPANVMVLPDGTAKLMDFGIAHLPASDLTRAGEVFGTPSNMSPEQAAGEPLDGRSDLFSLGTVLYQLLTGRRAFTGENLPKILAAVARDTPAPPSGPTVPRALDDVVAMALAKAPAERYPSGEAMAEDLEDVAAGRPPRHARRAATAAAEATRALPRAATVPAPARPSPPAAPVPPAFAGRRRAIVLAGVTFAALAVALFLVRGPSPPAPRAPAPPAAGAPAAVEDGEASPLTIDFEHHLRTGALRVWVDDALVLERELEGRLERRLAGRVRLYKGRVLETLEVTPERHTVRVEVAWDGKVRTSRASAAFQPGRARTLDVQVVRVLDDLVLKWR